MKRIPARVTFGSLLVAACLLLGPRDSVPREQAEPDAWEPVRFFVGHWAGTAEGQAGVGTVQRNYDFVLKDRFLLERNASVYPPQEADKEGETHEHWSFFSYDRRRKTLVLRQFHQEGFVNQYVLDSHQSRPGTVVFTSESFENFDNSWTARETYTSSSPDEFIETFELGAPGKALEVYSRNHFKRVK